MSYSKRQFIEDAFYEAQLAGYVFDLEPEDLQATLRQLDRMMATWNASGVRIGYPISTFEGSSLDQSTSVPDAANNAIVLNLALKIMSAFGKTPSRQLKVEARQSYNALVSRYFEPQPMAKPGGIPLGGGNRIFGVGRKFTPPPLRTLDVDQNSELDIY